MYHILTNQVQNSSTLSHVKLCKNTWLLYCVYLFILNLVFYFFFTYLKDEGRKWMMFIVCEERKIILKIKKNLKKYSIK